MSAKAFSVAAELRDDLARRFATVGAVAVDSDGLPKILVGSGAAGSQSALIKVADVAQLGTNAIGQTQPSYGMPLVIQVVLETSTIANTPLMTGANILPLLGAISHRGVRVELYLSANTNTVGPEDITSGNLKATWDPDLKWKTMAGM